MKPKKHPKLVLCLVIFSAWAVGFWAGEYLTGESMHHVASRLSKTPLVGSFVRSLTGVGTDPSAPPGRWTTRGQKHAERMEELQGLGYLEGTRESSGVKGVVVNESDSTAPGYNLYTSGHGPEAHLMSNRGRRTHTWRLPWERAFPDTPPYDRGVHTYWRDAHVYPNGDLLAIFPGNGIVKMDRQSNRIWSRRNGAHHDMWVKPDGTILVLTHRKHVVPRYRESRPVIEDYITIMEPNGHVRRRISVLKALINSPYGWLLSNAPDQPDVLHTNTLELLTDSPEGGSHPFVRGRALVSMPMIHTIGLVDLKKETFVWALGGFFQFQHDPSYLPNRRILLFDNWGHHGYSRAIEFNPFTQQKTWEYAGHPPHTFYSRCCGAVQRLPNGNTLITESGAGHAIELTPDGDVAWEFFSPHRAGSDDELVATLFEVRRLPSESLSWLDP